MNVKRILFFCVMSLIVTGEVCSAESSTDKVENDTKEQASSSAPEPTPPVSEPTPPVSEPTPPVSAKDENSEVPELTEKEKEEAKDVLDTVDAQSTSGNWVFKNYWWKKIQDIYSQIRDAFNTVMSARMKFFEQRSEVDKELDTFYQKIGFEQGPLQDILEYGLQVIEKEKEEQGYLDKKEQAFLAKVKEKQHQLEQLREDIKAIEELDQKIDDALDVVLKQVDVCNQYMQEAWNISRDVARELSDKEARKQYYDTKGLLDDVNKVHQYFVGPFTQYFDQMIKSVHDHTRGIVAQLETLKNSGLDLKKETQIFEVEDEASDRKRDEEQAARKKELDRIKEKKAHSAQEDTGIVERTIAKVKVFFGSISNYAVSLMTKSKSFFDRIIDTVKGWFFKAEEKVEAAERAVKKEVQKIEKDPQGAAYNAGKAIHEAVEDAAEYVEGKVEDAAEYVENKVEGVAEYGTAKSESEAIADLVVSLGEYLEVLERREKNLGDSARNELNCLRRLIEPLHTEELT